MIHEVRLETPEVYACIVIATVSNTRVTNSAHGERLNIFAGERRERNRMANCIFSNRDFLQK